MGGAAEAEPEWRRRTDEEVTTVASAPSPTTTLKTFPIPLRKKFELGSPPPLPPPRFPLAPIDTNGRAVVFESRVEVGEKVDVGKSDDDDDDDDDDVGPVIAPSRGVKRRAPRAGGAKGTASSVLGQDVVARRPEMDRDGDGEGRRRRKLSGSSAGVTSPVPGGRATPRQTPKTATRGDAKRKHATSHAKTPKTPRPAPSPSVAAQPGTEVAHQERRVRDFIRDLARKPQVVNATRLVGTEKDLSGPADFKLDHAMSLVLETVGVRELYRHQKEAIHAAIVQKRSVVVATPTASGKSLAYIIPLLLKLAEKRSSRALVLFPLKALANDQLAKLKRFPAAAAKLVDSGAYSGAALKRLKGIAAVTMRVCDGDTSEGERLAIREEKTQLLLTNADTLHHRILPGLKHGWSKSFWANLEMVVIDEAHTHSGVQGSHFANVMRRALRLCVTFGNNRTAFICTSATISNPREHVKALTTRDPVAVTVSGAPSGEKTMILWQPPEAGAEGGVTGEHTPCGVGAAVGKSTSEPSSQRRSPYAEAADIIASMVKAGVRCLAFVSARKLTESVCRDAKANLVKAGHQDLALLVDSYRAGYSVQERRSLERRLAAGEIAALVCTSALEMGIDVGVLDATVHVGVPDTAAAMWQQAGRSGRRQGCSVAVVVACERPVDSYYLSHPDELFRRRPEAALIDPSNVALLEAHLPCAAWECPLDLMEDAKMFDDPEAAARFKEQAMAKRGEGADNVAPVRTPFNMAVRRSLKPTPNTGSIGDGKGEVGGGKDGPGAQVTQFKPWNNGEPTLWRNEATSTFHCRDFWRPHFHVSLRGAPSMGEEWTLLDITNGISLNAGAREIEKVEAHRAMLRVYPGCIHLSNKGQFKVEHLDEGNRVAFCRSYERMESTHPRDRTVVAPLDADPANGVPEPQRRRIGAACVRTSKGRVRVKETVTGYVLKDHYTLVKIEERSFPAPGLPAADFVTDALWWDLPEIVVRFKITPEDLPKATAGVANLCAALVPAVAMCDARDIAGACVFHNATGDGVSGARIYLYDTCPNGVGLAAKAYDNLLGLWEKALMTVRDCPCATGCPSCVQAGFKGRDAGEGKAVARIALEGLLGTWMAEPTATPAEAYVEATVADFTTEDEANMDKALAAKVLMDSPVEFGHAPATKPVLGQAYVQEDQLERDCAHGGFEHPLAPDRGHHQPPHQDVRSSSSSNVRGIHQQQQQRWARQPLPTRQQRQDQCLQQQPQQHQRWQPLYQQQHRQGWQQQPTPPPQQQPQRCHQQASYQQLPRPIQQQHRQHRQVLEQPLASQQHHQRQPYRNGAGGGGEKHSGGGASTTGIICTYDPSKARKRADPDQKTISGMLFRQQR